MVQFLRSFFEKGTYDILYKNCNTFTDCCLYLLTHTRLDGKYTRMERFMMATNPVSTSLMNRIFRSYAENNTGQSCEVDIYVKNPLAEDFQVSEVVASIDELDEESEDSDAGVAAASSCFVLGNVRCCARDPSPPPFSMPHDEVW